MSSTGNGSLARIWKKRHRMQHAEHFAQRRFDRTWLAGFLIFAFILVACSPDEQTNTPAPEKPSPVFEEPTVVPDASSRLYAPQGNPATIDGVFTSGEWNNALAIDLANGELLLMHAEDYLFVGIRSDKLGLGSVCVSWDDEISILHSSAALGTASYEKAGEGWQKTRDFSWTNREIIHSQQAIEERREHLERENWLASNGLMGNSNEMEYQIALTDDQIRLAVTYLLSPEYTTSDFWPDTLGAGCRNFEPLQSDPPETVNFAPETWITIIASNE
jgi:hypothetical protein